MINFGSVAPFKANDLTGNFAKLFVAAGLGSGEDAEKNEAVVGEHIAGFYSSGARTKVQDKKYKSALFKAYLAWQILPTNAAYEAGKEFKLNAHGRHLTKLFFGEDKMDHEVPSALMLNDATAQIEWKQAA